MLRARFVDPARLELAEAVDPMGGELVIYAVAHQSREPGYWKPRLASVRP